VHLVGLELQLGEPLLENGDVLANYSC